MKSKYTILALSSLLATALPSHGANVLLLSDSFNVATTGVNDGLAARQDGTLKNTTSPGSLWTITGTTSISGNQLSVGNSSSAVNNADFEASLTSADLTAVSGFILSFDYTAVGTGFGSAFLSTHNFADERANSQFGFLVFGTGTMQTNGTGGVTAVSTAPLGGSFSVLNKNTYSFIATRTTATTGSYKFLVNGIELTTRNYAFDTGGTDGEVNFQTITNATGSGFYDNFSLTTVPEPSAALLGGLGLLALLRRRRHC